MRFAGSIYALLVRLWVTMAVLAMCACVPPSTEPPADLDTMDGAARVIDGATPPAMDRYKVLLETMTPADARAALVQELAATEGIASATLSSDGYTIRLVYTDGSTAAISTNELDLEPIDDQQLATLLDPIAKAGAAWRTQPKSLTTQARDLDGGWCFGTSWHEHRKVKIVLAASVTNPSLISVGQRLRDGFITRGWSEDEVTFLSRDGRLDTSIVPDDMLNNAEYGVVIIIAHSAIRQGNDGQDHYFIQCSGSEGSYATLDEINPDLRPKYARWTSEGKIELTWVWSEGGEKIPEYWLRDDLFSSEMSIDSNAVVHILSSGGCNLRDEFVDAHGVASFMCWDGDVRPNHGAATALAMFGTMGAETPQTDEQAYQAVYANGLAVSVDRDGQPVRARLADIPSDAYLPSWGDVWIPSGGVPDGTAQVQVKMEFPDACPEATNEFTMAPDEVVDFDYLTPGPVVITLEAHDGSGKMLGTGQVETTISAGHNGIGIETCTAALVPSVALETQLEFVDNGPNSVAVIRASLTPTDPDAPHPADLELDAPSFMGSWGYESGSGNPYSLWPGPATLTTRAETATGVVLGTSTQTVDMVCGENSVEICYGWAKLVVRKYPFNATKIRVTSITGGSTAWPILLAPGESRKIYGYDLNQTVIFDAEALDSFDQVLGSTRVFATLACGENEVPIDIISYGIILTASRGNLLPDGTDSSVITATLKEWLTGDILEPTGDPVAGKSVQFSTTLGTLTGTNPGITDANGQASVVLTGTQLGESDLHAYVSQDVVENHRMLHVLFRRDYGIAMALSSDDLLANGHDKVTITATLRKWRDTDTDQPTGDPVGGKVVTFSKSGGTFTGANPVTSDGAGQAAIQLSSTTVGPVQIAAVVAADGVEGHCSAHFKGEWMYCDTYLTGATYPMATWPTVYYYYVDCQWAKVAGATMYELEIYTDEPGYGGQYVQTLQTAGEVTAENLDALHLHIVEDHVGVANLDALYAAVAEVSKQYKNYWARVRVIP